MNWLRSILTHPNFGFVLFIIVGTLFGWWYYHSIIKAPPYDET